MVIRMILLHAREYPSGSTPKKSKLNTEPKTAIKKAIIDKAIRAFKRWGMIDLLFLMTFGITNKNNTFASN
jgi:hypothetical protein